MDTKTIIFQRYGLNTLESPIYLRYDRWSEIPSLFKELGFTIGAEIGVETGAFSKHLIQDNPDLHLYCIDFWEPYKLFIGHKSSRAQDNFYEHAKQKLSPYNCTLIKASSMDAIRQFEDESLDFVYIDANHAYEFVRDDIREWSKKVRKGGIVSGHDYYVFGSGNDGVVRAVDEYVSEHGIFPLFVCKYKKKAPSWFYIKE